MVFRKFSNKTIKWLVGVIVIVAAAILYKTYNPLGNNFFPKCPFFLLTGYKCPGCGSQRAIHYLLNFKLIAAIKENVLLVISIPYLLLGFCFDMIPSPGAKLLKWRKILFGQRAIYIILAVIIGFWVLRNIPFCLL